MVAVAIIDKEKIDEAYRYGLVKPNEFYFIRDNIIAREIYLRTNSSSMWDWALSKKAEDFYFKNSKELTIQSAIVDLAQSSPEKLLIDLDDIRLLILSDVAAKKAALVRDLGDLNKSDIVSGSIFADKDSIRALEYLLKYKKGLWELLSYIEDNQE